MIYSTAHYQDTSISSVSKVSLLAAVRGKEHPHSGGEVHTGTMAIQDGSYCRHEAQIGVLHYKVLCSGSRHD